MSKKKQDVNDVTDMRLETILTAHEEKEVPHDPDAEVGLLSAMMQSEEAQDTALQRVRPEDFYNATNRTVYDLFCTIINSEGQKLDSVTVTGEAKALGIISLIPPVSDFLERQISLDNVDGYANRIVDANPIVTGKHCPASVLLS